MKEKFIPQGDGWLINRDIRSGPAFGGGSDIFLSDCCSKNNESYANFPYSYNRAGRNQLERNKDTFDKFSGEYNFRVKEYEVFKLWFG